MSVNLEKAAPALDLSQFYGTENYYRHISGKVYTDGVQYFASQAGAYWFVDLVLLEMDQGDEPFLAVTLTVKGDSADILVTDGNLGELARKSIEWTDCPEGEYTFYICDGVMMLSSEY
jgi:hypothetical protein